MNRLEQKISHLPENPGVYLFKDDKGTILYVGKAGNIKYRVNSYFQKTAGKDLKTLVMLDKVSDIETLVTSTEKEAFILENNLIKLHHPRYNIRLKDDKNYPCLRLSMEEEFPTLSIVRRIKKDRLGRSLYFGPFPSATSLKETLKLIRRIFPIRTCLNTKFSNRLRPCINYEMGKCPGPCCGKIDPAQYHEMIHQIKLFLEGKNRELVERLGKKMEEEAEKLHFEAAAKIRDQIEHVQNVIEKQKIVSADFLNQDVIGFHQRDSLFVIHPLFIRGGKLLGGKGFTFPSAGLPGEEVLSSFLHQYYREGRFIPEQILIPKAISDQSLIEQWLTELKGKKVKIFVPMKGDKRQLLKMACENAEQFLLGKDKSAQDDEKLLENLKEKLHLINIPRRIEGFDISNLQGGNAVGSMVFFEDGRPNKNCYRHFKIKTVEGADDTGMMYEILLRRYQKAKEEKDLPNMVLLDGGRGQLNAAQEVFNELMINEVDLLSLAKERTVEEHRSSRQRKTEEKVYHPRYKAPLILEKHSPILHLLDRVRDEAHRFAITYHKKIRSRETITSVLKGIPGIGAMRQKSLLRYFGSVEKIREATEEELARAPKITPTLARAISHFFSFDARS